MLPTVPQVEIRNTGTAKGLGVFALGPYRECDVVEICSLLVFECEHRLLPVELQRVVFDWTELSKSSTPHLQGIALGYGGLYNHATHAAMRYQEVMREPPLLSFIAVRDISPGEELTINYNAIGGGPTWHENRWFVGKDITPVE